MIKLKNFEYLDETELIKNFKNTLKPKYGNKSGEFRESDYKEYNELNIWLKEHDYQILEFPNEIERQLSLEEFAYDELRNKIMVERNDYVNNVSWAERRYMIENLQIVKRYDSPVYRVYNDILNLFREISTGEGDFHTSTLDRQLELLNNIIENLLKKENDKFKSIEASLFYDYFGNTEIKKFRNDTQIFRHASSKSLNERSSWNKKKKLFYVRIGIAIVTRIYESKEDISEHQKFNG